MADERDEARAAAELVMELDSELEASGEATFETDALARARGAIHAWVDRAVGIVSTPALGRVTLIHANGRRSSISSADLPFEVSTPAPAPPTD